MDAIWKSCFEEELICPICLHVFVEPIQLPCKHNFCLDCISEAWAKDPAMVRCPECNNAYNQKPSMEKNLKLANIVEKFNALNTEKAQVVLQCILCRRGPPFPAQKVCLRCNAPCCQSHVQTHLQQPSTNPGHLLVDAEDIQAWSCPQHDEYRLYHCEAEQVAVCHYCCFSRCAPTHVHAVCDVEVRRGDIRQMLMKQQDQLEERIEDVEGGVNKLESDQKLIEDKVEQLKEQVHAQYQKMHQILDEDLGKALEVLEKAQTKFCQDNSSQQLQLSECRQEIKKMLGLVQVMFDKSEDINFMKNTKPVKILIDRTQMCIDAGLPPHKVGHLNSRIFLSEILKKEKSLRKMMEVPFNTPAQFLQSLPAFPCSQSISTSEKRKHSTAFPDSGTSAAVFITDASSSSSSKQPFLGHASTSGEGQTSQQPPASMQAHCSSTQHMGAQSVHHSAPVCAPVFTPSHYPQRSGSSQQAVLPQYSGRKILMCTVDNCYCSSKPTVSSQRGGHAPYHRSGSFSWAMSQEYPHPLPSRPAVSQPLQSLSMREWIDASQAHRHPDIYRIYGQSSTKHYITS
ncbi:E3 ubiquitin-protein ligase TRIM8a [Denticeps clupeoides]|uniref:E3 ubiquitin-protein ligase TRIM8 n=1 Tax=Denticeps clupeoides TaxID=299321 RepID=A0AAY4E179_9TELE|nr:E3 ubiquitin-protein ligase TRIM8-like [Denticeps clupeoides]